MSDKEHDCGDGCEHQSKLADELVDHVLGRLDGFTIQDALGVIGQVTAQLQATVYVKMKEFSVEAAAIDEWRVWRDGLVLEMEESMLRQNKKGGADGQG